MGKYLINRIIIAIPTFILITVMIFAMLKFTPGDPLLQMYDPELMRGMTTEQMDAIREEMGLNQSIIVQYFQWLNGLIGGNFGFSYQTLRPVRAMIGEALPNTLKLMGSSMILAMLIGIPIGIYSAVRQYSKFDYAVTGFSFFMMALPAFFFGMLMIYIFSIQLRIFPTGGLRSLGRTYTLGNHIWHLALPSLMLALKNSAVWVRYTRSSFLEVMNKDFIRTARSKGFKEKYILKTHSFPNAMGPIITIFGLTLPQLIVGAVITETIFAWPGLGRLMVNAIGQRDFPVVMGVTTLIAISVLFANILTDILYSVFDPRIRYE